MTDFALAHEADNDAITLANSCADQLGAPAGHTVGFIYVTSPIAEDLSQIIDVLKHRTGLQNWVGTVGQGICATGTEYFDRPAIAILACRFDEGAYQFLPSVSKANDISSLPGRGFVAGFGIVHGDPRNGETTEIISKISEDRGVYLVGGLSAAERAFPQVAGGRVMDGGVSGILFGGRLNVAVGLTQGCSPVGPAHDVTRCQDQVLVSLDRRRAYDVLCEDVGMASDADPRRWLANVHAALPVAGTDRADYVVRNLIGIDPSQGLVAIADTVVSGDRVMFVRRDRESAERDLGRMLSELKARHSTAPKAGLYYSCVARGPNLFREEAQELKAIGAAFGDIPIAGFFGNGEISHDRVYGYTGVLCLFS